MTLLGDAESVLFDNLVQVAGVTLTVTRDGIESTVQAFKGRSITERGGNDQIYTTAGVSDFIVRIATWVANVGGPPETNDYVEWTDDNSVVHNCQVAVDDRERHYDPSGNHGVLWRIHTVEI